MRASLSLPPLRRLLSAMLLCLALAAPASAANEAWLYNKGSFRPAGRGAWVEQNATAKFRFRETGRTAEYVELHDSTRRVSVRLYATTMYLKSPGHERWTASYHGRWDDAHKKPLDEDRNGTERSAMASPALRTDFPRLGTSFEVLGPATKQYNCIAWSIGVTTRWIWPGDTIANFDSLYGQSGYRRTTGLDYSLRPGVDKIVLYAKQKAGGSWSATHGCAAVPDGSWSSKLGALPLIRHLDPDDLDGSSYGVPVAVYVRPHRN